MPILRATIIVIFITPQQIRTFINRVMDNETIMPGVPPIGGFDNAAGFGSTDLFENRIEIQDTSLLCIRLQIPLCDLDPRIRAGMGALDEYFGHVAARADEMGDGPVVERPLVEQAIAATRGVEIVGCISVDAG